MADIGKRIKIKREALGITQEELAEKLGYKNKSSIAKIETGANDIVQSKVLEFAKALNTSVAYLMGWENVELLEEGNEQNQAYYLNSKTKEVAQAIYENKELSLLFDAAKDAKPEDLQTVHTMLLALKKKERGEQ